jgi:hypothetical protein
MCVCVLLRVYACSQVRGVYTLLPHTHRSLLSHSHTPPTLTQQCRHRLPTSQSVRVRSGRTGSLQDKAIREGYGAGGQGYACVYVIACLRVLMYVCACMCECLCIAAHFSPAQYTNTAHYTTLLYFTIRYTAIHRTAYCTIHLYNLTAKTHCIALYTAPHYTPHHTTHYTQASKTIPTVANSTPFVVGASTN